MRSYPIPSLVVLTAVFGATSPPAAWSADAPAKQSVRVVMTVPADAEVWFDGAKTTMQGTFRHFESPPLATGRSYHYQLRVRSAATGLDKTKMLTVRAGDSIVVHLDAKAKAAHLANQNANMFPPSYFFPSANTAPFSSFDRPAGGAPGQWNHFVLED